MNVVPARAGRATLATIAAAAGVSVATVSKVLNGRSDVSPTTRALVESFLQQHEYVPPSPRRGEGAQHPTIEVALGGELNSYSAEVIQGVLAAAEESGVAVVLGPRAGGAVRGGADRSSAWARELVAAGRRAVISITGEMRAAQLSALSRAHLPLVVIDPLTMPRARITSIGSTNFAGGLAATQHLITLGHRRIAYVGGHAAAACNQARLHGYRAAIEGAGMPWSPGYVRTGHFRYADGVTAGTALFALPQPPTAVFAGNDETALGLIEAGRTMGLRVPDDLSVVGFDDTELARMASPPLTTVRQPLREMGIVAVRTALRLAAGETIDSHHVELATELVIRGSTAAPGGAGTSPPAS